MTEKIGYGALSTALAVLLWSIVASVPQEAWNAARVYPAHLIAAGFPVGQAEYDTFIPPNLNLAIYSPGTSGFICPQVYPKLKRVTFLTFRPVFRRTLSVVP